MSYTDVFKKYEIHELRETIHQINEQEVAELLKPADQIDANLYESLERLKNDIIMDEMKNLNSEDVLSDIQLIEDTIDDKWTPMEKLRMIYIGLGKLFSYDYRVVNDPSLGYGKPLDTSKFIGRYQTCVQISQILSEVLNRIPGIRCNIIKRKLTTARTLFGDDHVANEVIVEDNGMQLKLLLDLTLDLFLIQSDCFTKHFGYEDDGTGTYDIIPLNECLRLDQKLGLVESEEDYTDKAIYESAKDMYALSESVSSEEFVDELIELIMYKFKKRFPGYHEGKQYINKIFDELLSRRFAYYNIQYREFNLFYYSEGEVNLKTVYRIFDGSNVRWILYSNKAGFIRVDEPRLINMLESGWRTNSHSLRDLLGIDQNNKEHSVDDSSKKH